MKPATSQRRSMGYNMPVFPNFPQVPSFKDPNYNIKKKVNNYFGHPESLIATIGELVAETWNKD